MTTSKNYNSFSKTLTSTEIIILDRDNNRKGLMIYNSGANPADIRLHNEDEYISLPAGQGWSFDLAPPQNGMSAKSTSGTTLVIWQA